MMGDEEAKSWSTEIEVSTPGGSPAFGVLDAAGTEVVAAEEKKDAGSILCVSG